MFREDLHNDVNPRRTPESIRPCTLADVDWLMELATIRYEKEDFDPAGVRAWLTHHLKQSQNDTVFLVRGTSTVGICHLVKRFLAPSRWQAYLILLVSTPQKTLTMEPYRITEAMVEWARGKGASKFWLSDISGFDLGAFARKLGGREAGHTYVIDLDDKGGRYG